MVTRYSIRGSIVEATHFSSQEVNFASLRMHGSRESLARLPHRPRFAYPRLRWISNAVRTGPLTYIGAHRRAACHRFRAICNGEPKTRPSH